MATIKTFSQIVQSFQDNIRLRRPALDTKPGTVSRDLFIDNPADQIAGVYRNMQLIQKTQSLLNATGKILDQFGSNFGIIREPGKRSSGNAVLTFSSIINNISIASGTTITAKTGVVYRVTANILISAATRGVYSSFASQISNQLHIAGISDQFAVQVPIEAVNIGTNGNIPVYSLIRTSIPGISNVTNIEPTSGGVNSQGDPEYRNSILAGLSGASAGTARGYKNALLNVSNIQDVLVVGPGSPILTRDGTVTQRNSDGSLTVLSPGTGGKVDIWVKGTSLVNITESYVFHDISGTGNPTSPDNAHILGQTTNTASLTPLERRQLFTQTGQLPQQPVDSIISLTGSVSGANFIQDVNYTLVKDTNPETENTAFALDKVLFLQNFISMAGENVAKGNVNSADSLVFRGIKSVEHVHQSIIVTNDIAALDTSDHTKITISHNPLNTVLRATNLTTGERYIITNQNLDPSTGLNLTGTVTIDGSVLPSAQDLVQVDYTWDFDFDATTDYFSPGTIQFVRDSIDWGKSNYINFESALLIRSGNRYNLSMSKNIDRVFSAFYCDKQVALVQEANIVQQISSIKALRQVTISVGTGPVTFFTAPGMTLISSGVSAGNKVHITFDSAPISRNGTYIITTIIDETTFQVEAVVPALTVETGNAFIQIKDNDDVTIIVATTLITNLATTAENFENVENVVSVKSQITGLELFATESGGSFSGNIIYLATDVAQPEVGESVLVYFNAHEIFNIAKNNGTATNSSIVLSTDDVLDFNSVLIPLNDIFNGINVKPIFADYIAADVDVVSRTAISLMPFVGSTATSILVDKNATPLVSRQPVEFNNTNIITRFGPAYLALTVDGAFSSGGTFAIKGTGWFKITASIPVSQKNVAGIFDLSQTISTQLGAISQSFSVVKVISASINNGIVDSNLFLRGYGLNNNLYDVGTAESITDINSTSIDLAPIFQQNDIILLSIGSTLDITFYVLAPNVSETVQFTTGRGVLYTEFKYTRVDRIDLISGFLNPSNSSITGNLRVSRLSQPVANSTYLADYSYFAPVENERITIQYRYNGIIQDATNAIENVRTLTADVLTRLALKIVVNVSITIILTKQAINQQSQILDQAISAVNNLILAQPSGSSLDYSALLRVVTAINGVSGADITLFDFVGSDFDGIANRKSIQADPNQYFVPGAINVVPGIR